MGALDAEELLVEEGSVDVEAEQDLPRQSAPTQQPAQQSARQSAQQPAQQSPQHSGQLSAPVQQRAQESAQQPSQQGLVKGLVSEWNKKVAAQQRAQQRAQPPAQQSVQLLAPIQQRAQQSAQHSAQLRQSSLIARQFPGKWVHHTFFVLAHYPQQEDFNRSDFQPDRMSSRILKMAQRMWWSRLSKLDKTMNRLVFETLADRMVEKKLREYDQFMEQQQYSSSDSESD